MSTKSTHRLALAGAVLTGALLLSAPAVAAQTTLPAPAIPGVAPLPGPLAAPSTPAASMRVLRTAPDIGAAGTSFTLSGSGLPAGKDVSIVWNTASVTWVVDARPDRQEPTKLGHRGEPLARHPLRKAVEQQAGVLGAMP